MADLGSHDDQVPSFANNGPKRQEKSPPAANKSDLSPMNGLHETNQPNKKHKRRRRRRRKPKIETSLPSQKPSAGGIVKPILPKKKDESRFQPMETEETDQLVKPYQTDKTDLSGTSPSEEPSPHDETPSSLPSSAPQNDESDTRPYQPTPLEPEVPPPALPEDENIGSLQQEPSVPLSSPDADDQKEPLSSDKEGQLPKVDYEYQYQYSDKPSVYEIGQDQSLYQPDQPSSAEESVPPIQEVPPSQPNELPDASQNQYEDIQIDATDTNSNDKNHYLETEEPVAQSSPGEVLEDSQKEELQKEESAKKAQKLTDELTGKSEEKSERGFMLIQKIVSSLASFLKKLFTGFIFIFGFIGRFFRWIGSFLKGSFNFRRLAVIFFMLLVLGGAYEIYVNRLPQKAYLYIVELFTPKTPPKVEVHVDEGVLDQIGINSILLFASNHGSVNDRIPSQIAVLNFFGHLLEPKVQGETGISGVTYYGELKDMAKDINEFVVYLQNLEKLQSLYKIDVYKMLDQSTKRDEVLLKYLQDLQDAKTKNVQLYQQMGINIDDLKASYDSLNPEKSKYETDFFAALDALQSEKSDALLKGFIDIVQKQSALKARINALAKVMSYYQTALDNLDKRIEAVDKNQEALIQGIHVTDVPGSGINIIIKP